MTAETETTPSTGSCCSPTGSCHDGAADVQIGQTDSVTTVYQVKGMTCGHCEGAVSEEISGIAGVTSVAAVAATGLVTVTSKAPWPRTPCAPPSTRPVTNCSARPPERRPAAAPPPFTSRTTRSPSGRLHQSILVGYGSICVFQEFRTWPAQQQPVSRPPTPPRPSS